MSTAVIIPWFGASDEHRRVNFEYVKQYYSEYNLFIGTGKTTGEARNNGALEASAAGHSVFFFVDADILVPHNQIFNATVTACAYETMVTAYSSITRLSQQATQNLLCGVQPYDQGGRPESGAIAITSSSLSRVNGYPHLSVFEDALLFNACRSLLGEPQRIDGPALHLWHPPSDHLGDQEHRDILARSESSIADPGQMALFVKGVPYASTCYRF